MILSPRGTSAEVMQEELHTAAAWIRDLPQFPPRVTATSITIDFPATLTHEDEDGEAIGEEDAICRIEITRLADGRLVITGPGLNGDIDHDLLREKRP